MTLMPITNRERRDQTFLLIYCATMPVWLCGFAFGSSAFPWISIPAVLSFLGYVIASPWALAVGLRTKTWSTVIASAFPIIFLIAIPCAVLLPSSVAGLCIGALIGGTAAFLASLSGLVSLAADLSQPQMIVLGCNDKQHKRRAVETDR